MIHRFYTVTTLPAFPRDLKREIAAALDAGGDALDYTTTDHAA